VSSDTDSGGRPATVAVTGASSQLGVFLLPRLEAAGFRVMAISRAAPRSGAAPVEAVEWLQPDVFLSRGGRDRSAEEPVHLVSCGPLALARKLVQRFHALQRVVAFSSSSVQSKMQSPDRAESRLMATMAEEEKSLADACAERGVPLLLLRPTLIYGCGRDRNVSLLAGLARRTGVIPLARQAGGLRQPVHADDLAGLAVRALAADEPVAMVSEACGGTTLTYRDMVQRVAAAVPRRVRLVTLPVGLFSAMVWLVSRLPEWRGLSTEMVRRQNRDLVFDDSGLRRVLGWSPRPFEPTAADFEVPESARALQLPPPPNE
jgi:nucleoside-diphosphate-sugar epimerase